MLKIRIVALIWDDVNEAHIWERHQLTRVIVEEVCYGNAHNIQVDVTYGGRFLIVGPGRDDKLYAIVLGPNGEDTYYPVTARRASKKERNAYKKWRAGLQP